MRVCFSCSGNSRSGSQGKEETSKQMPKDIMDIFLFLVSFFNQTLTIREKEIKSETGGPKAERRFKMAK
jgi:hypothetical protein